MKKKTFEQFRIIIVILLAITVGVSVSQGYSVVVPISIIVATFLVYYFWRKVDEVTVDERDYKIAGKGAIATLNITTITLVIIGATLVASGINYPEFSKIGYLFLYIVCFILIIKIITFMFYQKKGDK